MNTNDGPYDGGEGGTFYDGPEGGYGHAKKPDHDRVNMNKGGSDETSETLSTLTVFYGGQGHVVDRIEGGKVMDYLKAVDGVNIGTGLLGFGSRKTVKVQGQDASRVQISMRAVVPPDTTRIMVDKDLWNG